MILPYKNDIIDSPDGIPCRVLDVVNVSFTNSSIGRKSSETLVIQAKGGESIITKNTHGQIESIYEALPGEAIFVNPHNKEDKYVPANLDGTRWKFSDLTHKGYEIIQTKENGEAILKSTAIAQLLHEVVLEPTCIKDAWGPGQHQFLFAGATLKKDSAGRITGIDKTAFDATWEITKKSTEPLPKNSRTRPKLG